MINCIALKPGPETVVDLPFRPMCSPMMSGAPQMRPIYIYIYIQIHIYIYSSFIYIMYDILHHDKKQFLLVGSVQTSCRRAQVAEEAEM